MQRQNHIKNKFDRFDNKGFLNINTRIIECHILKASCTGIRVIFLALLRGLLDRGDLHKPNNARAKDGLSQIYLNLKKVSTFDEFAGEYKKACLYVDQIEYNDPDNFTLKDIFEYMATMTGLDPDGTIKNVTSDTFMDTDDAFNKKYALTSIKLNLQHKTYQQADLKTDLPLLSHSRNTSGRKDSPAFLIIKEPKMPTPFDSSNQFTAKDESIENTMPSGVYLNPFNSSNK